MGETGTVRCPQCHATYAAAGAQFCDCLTADRTPVCPSCTRCLCRLSRGEQQAFWSAAPADLVQRAHAERRQGAADAETADSAAPGPDPLAVVADDDAVARAVAKRLLERLGFRVALAERGDQALDLVRALRPALVLTDALMPKLDGRELCRRLKQDPGTAAIKVVVMSGVYTKSSERAEVLGAYRADGFLVKPSSFEEFRALIQRVFVV